MATFLLDNFTGSGNVSAHTSDSGHSWTNNSAFTGVPTLASGTAVLGQTSGASCGMYASVTPANQHYRVDAVVKMLTVVANDVVGITARGSTSAKSYYEARYLVGTGWQLNKVAAGTRTQIGSNYTGVTLTAGQSATVSLVCMGKNIAMLVNGVVRASGVDTTYATAGVIGFEITSGTASGTPSATTSCQLDQISATLIASCTDQNITYTPIGQPQETHGMQVVVPAAAVLQSPSPTLALLGGTSQRGTANTSQFTDGLAQRLFEQADTWPVITAFVEWPTTGSYGGREWAYPAVPAARAFLEANYACDANKRFISGYSLGAFIALEILATTAADWAGVLAAEGFVSSREGILTGNDPAGTWTDAQAQAQVAAAIKAANPNLYIRQYQSTADANTSPASAEATRDAFQVQSLSGYGYSELSPVTGLDHVSAYNAVYSTASILTALFSQTRSLPSVASNAMDGVFRRRRR